MDSRKVVKSNVPYYCFGRVEADGGKKLLKGFAGDGSLDLSLGEDSKVYKRFVADATHLLRTFSSPPRDK